MNHHTNGAKEFLFVITLDRLTERDTFVLRGDHDPSPEEIVAATKCDFRPDEGHELQIERYGLDEIRRLPPRKVTL